MFVRLLYESFRRQKRRKLLAGVAITLGVGVATAMIAVATDIGDKINRELRTYGANLVVTPQEDTLDVEIGGVNLKPPSDGAYLNEADLPKIKGMFWRNNIVGFAPMLPVNVDCRRDSKIVTLLGTYFSQQLDLRQADISPPACAPRIPGGRCRAHGRTTIRQMSCSASVWQQAEPGQPGQEIEIAGQPRTDCRHSLDRRPRR